MPNIPLKGSNRTAFAGSHALAPADRNERLEVSVLLRRRARDALADRARRLAMGKLSSAHLGRDDFAKQFAAESADVSAVKAFAEGHELAVVQTHAARRTLVLSGTVAQFERAFEVQLKRCEHAGGTYRGREGSIHVPASLDGVIEAVLGLDDRPQAAPHFRMRKPRAPSADSAESALATSFTPIQLAALYDFPQATGQGECVAIIELGGGFRPADLQTYFAKLNVGPVAVRAISVDHAKNHPTHDASGPDGEVMLDVEVIGALAPLANVAVYFAPNTDAGFLNAVSTAIHDAVNKPSIISISWGSAESTWTEQAMSAMDEAFQAAATMGVTVCVACGDGGSSDGAGGDDHVDFPASSPYALACGGTTLRAGPSAISSETVWNDGSQGGASGGGVSSFFPLPPWQNGLSATRSDGTVSPLKHRGVPDVSADADPQTGYQVRIDGADSVIGGTSAVAPLWAGLIARINQIKAKPAGYVQPQLYKQPSALRDITGGSNGDFSASTGWDACTGLGSPDGKKVAEVL